MKIRWACLMINIVYVTEAQKSTVNEQIPKNVQTKPEILAESVGLRVSTTALPVIQS